MKHNGFIDLHAHGLRSYDTKTADPHDILKIAGSGLTLADSVGVLEKIGMCDDAIIKAGVLNSESYLNTPSHMRMQ